MLIYFHADVVHAVVRALAARLRPGGWLLLGQRSRIRPSPPSCIPVSLPAPPPIAAWTTTRRRPPRSRRPPGNHCPSRRRPSRRRRSRVVVPRPARSRKHRPAPHPEPGLPPRRPAGAGRCRDLEGGWMPAARPCAPRRPTRACASTRVCSPGRGDDRRKPREPFAGRSTFDKGFVMAHYHLGLTLIAAGRTEAVRPLPGQRPAARRRPAGRHGPARGDGLTAGLLRETAAPLLAAGAAVTTGPGPPGRRIGPRPGARRGFGSTSAPPPRPPRRRGAGRREPPRAAVPAGPELFGLPWRRSPRFRPRGPAPRSRARRRRWSGCRAATASWSASSISPPASASPGAGHRRGRSRRAAAAARHRGSRCGSPARWAPSTRPLTRPRAGRRATPSRARPRRRRGARLLDHLDALLRPYLAGARGTAPPERHPPFHRA